MLSKIKNFAVIGAGFMGVQISSIAALAGYCVKVYDPNSDAPAKGIGELKGIYALQGLTKQEDRLNSAQKMILYCDSLSQAVSDADLIIEAVSENIDLKKKVFNQIDINAPNHAIIASNSSSIPVTKLEDAVTHKERVLNIHFDSPLIDRPLVDIMPGTKTGAETIEIVKVWVESIDCIPVVLKKPIMGFLGNRLWRVVKRESLKLWAGGYGHFMDIDRSWMLQLKVELGPFAMMDVVGLDVVYAIEMAYYNESGDPQDLPPQALKEMIDKGELGLKTGKGFYDWSDPEFIKPDFIKKKVG
ncbi:MAG: 3-hydroxyacyl-CoA dehydrogenase family protein [Dehalococcoidia bacterium]|nr:MAG: 3-hydroxyacyl-CoA dehydrogenase family protein [Dehalococcoidia bacterium]